MLHPSFSWVEEVETHLGSLLFEIAFFPKFRRRSIEDFGSQEFRGWV
jgi:hypothetical protein